MGETLDTVTGSGTLNDISGVLDRIWSAHSHVPHAVRLQIGIAVHEIGSNIVKHASRGRSVRLRMAVDVRRDEVEVTFTDDGPPVAVDLGAVSMPHEMAEGGRGLALAQATLGRLNYGRDMVNRWTLISKRFT